MTIPTKAVSEQDWHREREALLVKRRTLEELAGGRTS
jgi:hypothetical protein